MSETTPSSTAQTGGERKAHRRAWAFLTPLIIFGVLAGLLFWGLGQDPRKVPSPLVGKPIPTFTLPSLDDPGLQVSDADLKGRVSLVNVWASWCASCRAEHGMLMALTGDPGFQIVGLNWKDAKTDALAVLGATGNPYDLIGYDPDNEVGLDWGVYGAPETFVVDREGIIRYKHIGPIDRRVWDETLEPLVTKLTQEG
jgi:cytochrome c biogenesis protein CcmG/thiol:disulfide interchange protein DsbE